MNQSILELINNFIESDDESFVITEQLTGKERSEIHEYIKQINLYSTSVHVSGSTHKHIIVMKNNKSSSEQIDNDNILKADSMIIDTFCTWTSVPIPVLCSEYLDYYLDTMNPYFNCKQQFKEYIETIKDFKSLTNLKKHINEISEKIIKHILEKNEYKEFRQLDDKYKGESIKPTLYSQNNHNKWFISIDIKKANFTIMNYYFPDLFNNKSWSDFVMEFTNCKFIIDSKYFRELIFGKLRCTPQVLKLAPLFLDKIRKLVEANENLKYLFENIISLECDEMIFSLGQQSIEKDKIEELRSFVEQNMPNFFKVELFNIEKISQKPFYIKKHDLGKIEFKCCPKKFIMQCIKFYEKKEIISLDLKFMDENYVATYDKPIFGK
jgi:hypothetical protein